VGFRVLSWGFFSSFLYLSFFLYASTLLICNIIFLKKKPTFQIASLRCPQREIEIMGDLGLEQKII
jgi:hypothetical protein